MTALLDIRGLSLSYTTDGGNFLALDNVDLSLQPREIVGLVGESGCGKSSLAHAILGTLPKGSAQISAGDILLTGIDMLRDGNSARTLRGRDVTFIPQDPFASFSPLFRIGTQIADLMRGLPVDNELDPMLSAVQLPDRRTLLAKYPHELSGGQLQRLMIALALFPHPRLVVADEPTTALDVTIQAQILGLLRRLSAERGASVLYITHDLGTAWEICDRVVVMYAGRIVEAAPRETFFSKPQHPYTRMLQSSLIEPGRELVGIPGHLPDLTSPPKGCSFSPRCPCSTLVCQEVRPAAISVEAGHLVACHHPQAETRESLHV